MDAGRRVIPALILGACAQPIGPELAIRWPEPGARLPAGERAWLCLQVEDDDPVGWITHAVTWRGEVVAEGLLDEGGCDAGNATVAVDLDAGEGVLAVALLDGHGGRTREELRLEVAPNEPPRCHVQLPETDSTWSAGATVPFAATIEDDALDPTSLQGVLQSNLDGLWWQGSPDAHGQVALYHEVSAPGQHVLSLAVTDPLLQADTCTRTFFVE